MGKLRAYQVSIDGDDMCECVIAESSKEAKKIGWRDSEWLSEATEYTDVRVKWLKDGNTEGLNKGIYEDYIDALKRKFFSSVWEVTCPKCGTQETVCYLDDDGQVFCSECEED